MAPRLRALSSKEVLRALRTFGFEVISVTGSHAKVRRLAADGSKQVLVVPLHRELRPGTIRSIYKQALRYVPVRDLKPWFYTC